MATSRRYSIGSTLGLILAGLACQAVAEPPAATPSSSTGLMAFPNVRVTHAPPAASEQQPAAAPEMQAYVDPETGELRAATAEEARLLSNATAARPRTRQLANSTATAASTDEERLIFGPGNTVGLLLGEESMVFQTVQLDADGNLIQQCVTGEDQATHALHSAAAQPTQQESHNDR
jgi:hypothetical protein